MKLRAEALRDYWWAYLIMIVAFLAFGYYFHYLISSSPTARTEDAMLIVKMMLIIGSFGLGLYFFMIYGSIRNVRTRAEVEQEERAKAQVLLDRYPDLRAPRVQGGGSKG